MTSELAQTSQNSKKLNKNRFFGRTVAVAGPTLAGTAIPSAAIIWAHAENIATNQQVYLVSPPTVSRALTNPLVEGPFAATMIVGAIFLSVAVAQVVRIFWHIVQDYPAANTLANKILIALAAFFEIPAILGMVILSQYVGEEHALMHDTGSYMLFFGHSFAIIICGIMIKRLRRVKEINSDSRMMAMRKHPAHAAWVAVCSALFGIAYFAGKRMPDEYTFSVHLAVSIIEIVSLIAFLTFFGRFWKLLLASDELRQRNRRL